MLQMLLFQWRCTNAYCLLLLLLLLYDRLLMGTGAPPVWLRASRRVQQVWHPQPRLGQLQQQGQLRVQQAAPLKQAEQPCRACCMAGSCGAASGVASLQGVCCQLAEAVVLYQS
jgi:hypothetical protein